MDVGAVKAPTIWRSQACNRLRQSVSTSQSRYFRSTASTRKDMWFIRRQLKRRCSGGLSEGAAMPGWYRGVAAPTNPTHVKKALANPEPCTHGALSRHSNPSDEYPLLMVDRV